MTPPPTDDPTPQPDPTPANGTPRAIPRRVAKKIGFQRNVTLDAETSDAPPPPAKKQPPKKPADHGLPRLQLKTTRSSDHPWVFRKMVRNADLPPGSWVEAEDRDGRIVGSGIYNGKSQIALRMISQDPSRPATDAFILDRLRAAIRMRRHSLGLDARTNAYRLVHAEADGLSGLVIDRLGPYLVVELFSHGWFRKLKLLQKNLPDMFAEEDPEAEEGSGIKPRVLVRANKETEQIEGFRVRDFLADQLSDQELRPIIEEDGVQFRVDLRTGHKTGYFCDQRDNRAAVAGVATGRRMLDAFCYTGGFTCHAIAAEAEQITAVDLDEKAVAVAQENIKLNGGEKIAKAVHADAFDYLRDRGAAEDRYGVVVLDPPKLARGKGEVDAAMIKYADMNRLAIPLLDDDGLLVANSCSGAVSEGHLMGAMRRAATACGVQLQVLQVTGAAPDHPVAPNAPESKYLKCVYARVMR